MAVLVSAALLCVGLAALGTWQLARRAWKLDLIARVDQRVHAPAEPAPAIDAWAQITPARDEYRHVRVSGTFRHDLETLVQAATELGSGHWVLTPLQLADGSSVLVNRGFVPPEQRDRVERSSGNASGITTVTGLLRISEPGGAFLRHNDAAANRWYSRDVQAIAAARGLSRTAPYFIDADAATPPVRSGSAVWPQGGLTVTSFHNNHLAYAITWYVLAAMTAAGAAKLLFEEAAPQSPDTKAQA